MKKKTLSPHGRRAMATAMHRDVHKPPRRPKVDGKRLASGAIKYSAWLQPQNHIPRGWAKVTRRPVRTTDRMILLRTDAGCYSLHLIRRAA